MDFLIGSDQSSEHVFLKGQSKLINALEKEIQTIIHKTKRDVYSMVIPTWYHKDLCQTIREIYHKTKALVLRHSNNTYSKFKDPTVVPEDEDMRSVVKIIATQDAFTQAQRELDVH